MCNRCAELENEIAWLKDELKHVDNSKIARIQKIKQHFKVTPSGAHILLALYEAKRSLMTAELDDAVPQTWTVPTRLDPEYRGVNTIRVQIYRVRATIGKNLFPRTNRWNGYALSDAGREAVKAALA